MSDTPNCDHKFVLMRSVAWIGDSGGGYNQQYIRLDTFFCEKCLEEKQVRKEEWSRDMPEWYRGK